MGMDIENQVSALLAQASQYGWSAKSGVCEHTDDITKGDIYVANNGGLKFIDVALEKGASLVIYDACAHSDYSGHSQAVALEDFRKMLVALVDRIYGDIVREVGLVGVTGTNGKTSTASFCCQLLNAIGVRAGYIGTLGYGVVGESVVQGRNTTPDVVTLYRYIYELHKKGCRTVVMEVSSHGIALERIQGLSFVIAAFTNLSRDHLDFHGSMVAYEAVKRSYFLDYRIDGVVVNLDDAVGQKITDEWLEKTNKPCIGVKAFDDAGSDCDVLSYKTKGLNAEGAHVISLHSKGGDFEIMSRLHGRFNTVNLVTALAICHALGHRLEVLSDAVREVSPVPGRLENYRTARDVNVFIDYAHTPAGIETVLADDTLDNSESWCVIGCGGDRDSGKRPHMAKAASKAAHLVICDDNVRHDSATQIIIDMLEGIEDKAGTAICRDRKLALAYSLDKANPGSHVFVLGKGNEADIDYGIARLPWRDRDAVTQFGGAHVS